MLELRLAEKRLIDLCIELHWLAGRTEDAVTALHLRQIADKLNDEAHNLRDLCLLTPTS